MRVTKLSTRRLGRLLAAGALAIAAAGPALAQGGLAPNPPERDNIPYDGRFTFVRLYFEPLGGGQGFWGRRDLKWDHDYPKAERHFTKILSEITALRPHLVASNILAVDSPELFKYPVAYLSEPGFWTPTEKEATNLRNYLLKGGFLIFDDFVGQHWITFAAAMQRVLPQGRLVQLDASHPIFDSFFKVKSLEMFDPTYGRPAQFYGIFEDNDPRKRLMVIVNYNNDIGDYWEWSDAGFFPMQLSNEAYKLGVNYVIYAMTR